MNYNLKITGIVYNSTIKKVLLDTKENIYVPVVISSGSDLSVDPEKFSEIVSQRTTTRLKFAVQYIGFIDIEVTELQLTLATLFLSNEIGESNHLESLNLRWIDINTIPVEKISPTIRNVLQQAEDVCMRREISVELSQVSKEISHRVLTFLEQKFVRDGKMGGWPHYLGQPQLGVIGTAMGALCYYHSGVASSLISEAQDTIRKSQNEDGGWPIKSLLGKSGISVTESTLFCLWALTQAGLYSQDATVVRAVKWLEDLQRKDGGWGSSAKCERARVFPTAFSVRILSAINVNSKSVKSGVTWLQRARNADEGWGPFSSESVNQSPSSSAYTAHAVLALLHAGIDPDSDIIKGGIRWLLNRYEKNKEEGWESAAEVEYVDEDSAIDYRHYSTPWCIVALIKSGVAIHDGRILESCKEIVRRQHALGYWTHRFAPGQMPIWATHDCLYALREIVKEASLRFDMIARLADIDDENMKLRKALLGLTEKVVRSGIAPKSSLRAIYWWNTGITIAVALLIVFNSSFQSLLSSSPLLGKVLLLLTPFVAALLTSLAPFIYSLILEEYKLRRGITKLIKA